MRILRDLAHIAAVANPFMRELAALRFRQLNSPDAPDAPDATGCFIVVDPGDTAGQLEQEIGWPILHGLCDDLPYDDPDFTPCFEILEEHRNETGCIYEMVFISDDDGTFTALLIPDTEGIPGDLLALCQTFATPIVTAP